MPTVNRTNRPWLHKVSQPDAPPVKPNHQTRSNPNRHIYGTYRWTKASREFRERNPLCVECLKHKRITDSKVTDHIVPINQGGDPWDESNWQSLCSNCHNEKSARERHQ